MISKYERWLLIAMVLNEIAADIEIEKLPDDMKKRDFLSEARERVLAINLTPSEIMKALPEGFGNMDFPAQFSLFYQAFIDSFNRRNEL